MVTATRNCNAACSGLSVLASSESPSLSLSLSAILVEPSSSTNTPRTGEQLHHAGDYLVQHRLQRHVGRIGYFYEDRFVVGVAPVHAVQHQAVQVDVEIGG